MIESLISGMIHALPEEQKQQLKSASNRIAEFLPMIQMYHSMQKLQGNERNISYLLKFEKDTILLMQVALELNEDLKKVVVSRTLASWDIAGKIKELTENL